MSGDIERIISRRNLQASKSCTFADYLATFKLCCPFVSDPLHLEIHASNTDLELYVGSKIQQDHHLARNVRHDLSLQEEIVVTVVGNAKGM